MGLDTVELIEAIERRFDISISDREAEQVSTVADCAVCVCQHRQIPVDASRSASFYVLLEKTVHCLNRHRPIGVPVGSATMLQSIWSGPQLRNELLQLGNCLLLTIPTLESSLSRTGIVGWLLKPFEPDTTWHQQTIVDFVDWVMALNHEKLLPEPQTLYEVERVVVGITSERSGLPVQEIQLSDRFTYDLGME
jgi:hypothetical protein